MPLAPLKAAAGQRLTYRLVKGFLAVEAASVGGLFPCEFSTKFL
jgi:hypothetical protein